MKKLKVKEFVSDKNENIILSIKDNQIVKIERNTSDYDYYLFPAFIDIHTHGFKGLSSESVGDELKLLPKKYLSRGIGGFLATIGPRSYDEYNKIFEQYRDCFFKGEYTGAKFLGFHLEGPHLNKIKCGAIDPNGIYGIDLVQFEQFIDQNKDIIRVMTIAPEIENGLNAIDILSKHGVIASAGHTDANYDIASQAVERGLKHSTHTFNAMRSIYHRNPNLITKMLLDSRVKCELIADGYHVDKSIIQLIKKLKGKKGVIIVSDSGEESGFEYKDGYVFENGNIVVKGAIMQPNGVIAGSTKDICMAIKDLVNQNILDLGDIKYYCSLNALESLGIDFPELFEGEWCFFNLFDKELNFIECIM